MTKRVVSRWWSATIWMAVTSACAGKDTTDLGGNAGASGAGGAQGATHAPRFRAVLTGNEVQLTALDPVWFESCEDNPRLIQKLGNSWALLRDERPPALNLQQSAHYLDGILNSACDLSEGCDVLACMSLAEQSLRAVEYLSVGQRLAPVCGVFDAGPPVEASGAADAGSDSGADSGAADPDAGGRLVPNIESHAPTGPLAVRIRYYPDSQCGANPTTVDVPVE